VVLLDVRMPEGNGLDCLARIKLDLPEIPVVMFSSFDNPTYVARAVALGASGYLSKGASRKELVDAIHAAASGEKLVGQFLFRARHGRCPTRVFSSCVPA